MSRENLFIPYANNKDADQHAHAPSLISIFVIRCLDSTLHMIAKSEIQRLFPASVAERAGFSLTVFAQPLKTDFLMMWL